VLIRREFIPAVTGRGEPGCSSTKIAAQVFKGLSNSEKCSHSVSRPEPLFFSPFQIQMPALQHGYCAATPAPVAQRPRNRPGPME
jgi:hypothetical protein